MKNIPALTGLRFFSAMAIVLWHSQTGYFFASGAFAPFYLAGAVPVFFVLSGFVLTLGADRYRSWSSFFVARVARVWPAHIAALAFLFWIFYPYTMDFFRHAETERQLALNVLLMQAWSPKIATYWSYNAPSWSVSCELFFYAMFPLAFPVLRQQTLLRAMAVAGCIVGAIVTIDIICPGVDSNWLGAVNPVSGFAAFAIGIATGIWYKRLPAPRISGTAVQVTALALALGANALFASHPVPVTPSAALFLGMFGPAPLYAAFILALARYDGAISRVLSYPPIVYGGEISYSIYLFHQIIIRWHSGKLADFATIPIWLQYACILAATFAISIVVHHMIERPVRRWIISTWRLLVAAPVVSDPDPSV